MFNLSKDFTVGNQNLPAWDKQKPSFVKAVEKRNFLWESRPFITLLKSYISLQMRVRMAMELRLKPIATGFAACCLETLTCQYTGTGSSVACVTKVCLSYWAPFSFVSDRLQRHISTSRGDGHFLSLCNLAVESAQWSARKKVPMKARFLSKKQTLFKRNGASGVSRMILSPHLLCHLRSVFTQSRICSVNLCPSVTQITSHSRDISPLRLGLVHASNLAGPVPRRIYSWKSSSTNSFLVNI